MHAGAARVADGVQLLAGGLEALLQRLRVTAHRIAVRVELPSPSAEADEGAREPRPGTAESGVLLRLSAEEVVYCGVLPSAPHEASKRASSDGNSVLQKMVTFSGLTVDLERLSASPTVSADTTAELRSGPGPVKFDHSRNECLSGENCCNSNSSSSCHTGGGGTTVLSGANGIGLEGRLQLHLMGGSTVTRTAPRAAVHLTLQPLCLQLCQPQLALVVEACTLFAAIIPANHFANGQPPPATAERYV